MSAPITGRPSKAARVKAMHMLSRDTTPAKLEVVELRVLRPSFTQRAFLVKSIFKSKMMCPDALYQPGGALPFGPRISKATHTLPISLASASCQRVFLFFRSISIACLTEEGTSIPYLWLVLRTREFTAEIITSLFRRT